MLVESRGLPSDSTCFLEAESGKLDIKRQEPGFLFINLHVGLLFKQGIIDFHVDSMSLTPSFKKYNVMMTL